MQKTRKGGGWIEGNNIVDSTTPKIRNDGIIEKCVSSAVTNSQWARRKMLWLK